MTQDDVAQMSREELVELVLAEHAQLEALREMSIAALCVPVIAALMCTTKRSVDGVRILDFWGLQKLN
jgi:hypothetical protein